MEKAISTADPPDSGLEKNLRQALDTLSPIYKLPVILKDVEGYSQEEIAEILNKPVGTIKARISRGRGILKTALEKARSDKSYRVKNEEYSHGRA
jgi:RNA polymerase sigma-70 factor (ECF subfamily)